MSGPIEHILLYFAFAALNKNNFRLQELVNKTN